MGSEASLYFDNIQVDWEKNAPPPVCRVLFRPTDLLQVPLQELPPDVRALYGGGRYFDSEPQRYSVLISPSAPAEQRLSILGYSRSRAEEAWNLAKIELAQQAKNETDPAELRRAKKEIATQFSAITYQEWQNKYTKILKEEANGTLDNSAETYLFRSALDNTEIANDPLMWIAIQLYALEPVRLFADLTDVIESEYETKETIFGENEAPNRFSHAFGKITLLTEGITDSRILRASLNKFYPEAKDLYSFVDFEEFKVEGGASPLARLLRGFAGAGLTDRFIAIFDNDAAGHEALTSLRSVALPPNIRAITLPDTEFARDYPTVGPTGKANADVNGGAASIEMFLGREALTRGGQLRPVRWSQWNRGAERYQGEIEGKLEVSERYLSAIKETENSEILRRTFSDMDAVLRTIFNVFA